MTCTRRFFAPLVALLVTTAAVAAAVRTWRRHRPVTPEAAPPVDDRVLADRIRSELGVVEHRLDTPRIHVEVERGVALLHGEVPSDAAAHLLIDRVLAVSGVRDVVSHLHVGLLDGDTRPSAGEGAGSQAAHRLVDAARSSGAGEVTAALAARRVLASFAATLPARARRRIGSHLPPDVAVWLTSGDGVVATTGTTEELYAHVAEAGVMPPAHVPWVVDGVLAELASLVPGDIDDVASALPVELGHLWSDAVVRSSVATVDH